MKLISKILLLNSLCFAVSASAVTIHADLYHWLLTTAKTVDDYFKKPYPVQTTRHDRRKVFCANNTFVHRPNHSLAHGMRQAFHSLAIVDELSHIDPNTFPAAHDLVIWVQMQLKDRNFLKKLVFASAFQRTGRFSEEPDNPMIKDRDAQNFDRDVQQYIGVNNVFRDDSEGISYMSALQAPDFLVGDARHLKTIFELSHTLDLRRLAFDQNKSQDISSFQDAISQKLFGVKLDRVGVLGENIVARLWQRSGFYLENTGDRDRDPSVARNKRNEPVFCDQATNLPQMIFGLSQAFLNPREFAKLRDELRQHPPQLN